MRRQFLLFAVVGVLNTVSYFSLYLLFLRLMPYAAAHVAAFALSLAGSFFLNVRFTYRTRPTWRKFLLFPLTNAAGFAVNTLGVLVLVEELGADATFAPLLAALAAVPVTFLLSRAILLGRQGAPKAQGAEG